MRSHQKLITNVLLPDPNLTMSSLIEGLIKGSCVIMAGSMVIFLITFIARDMPCDEITMCFNANNGSVFYKDIMSTCLAKPNESWPCEWLVDEPCPTWVRCAERSDYNGLTMIIWISCIMMLLCCLLMCATCYAESRYDNSLKVVPTFGNQA